MRSLQVELDQFFANISLPEGRIARDDAFRMARKKLDPAAFIELNQHIIQNVPTTARWHGLRVIAADSSTLKLPTTHPDTLSPDQGFDCYHHPDGVYSLARAAGLCDTATGLMLCADLASDATGEREMLVDQLHHLAANDLLVLDRGYPAYWLFALLGRQQRAFCMRLSLGFNPQVRAFVASGQPSRVVTITPGAAQRAVFAQHQMLLNPFTLRLVRVVLPNGQIEVLATNLLDETRHPAADFAELYHRRWRIEEAFRNLKSRLRLEQFGGETPLAIRQEFHATILLHNLATLAGLDALAQQAGATPGTHAANLAHAGHLIRLHLPRLLTEPAQRAVLCQIILAGISKQITRRRLGRPGPPRQKNRSKPHPSRSYK